MKEVKLIVGKRIKELRLTQSSLSLEDFAKKLNCDSGYLSRIENGKQNITIETLNTICETLGVSLSVFFKPLN